VQGYSNQLLQLAPEQVDEFKRIVTSRMAIMGFFGYLKGLVAAGETAARKINEIKSGAPDSKGGIL
jgi:hypothetical protein